jgi:hypothetical protein
MHQKTEIFIPTYIQQQLTEESLSRIQTSVGICKQVIIVKLYQVSHGLVTLL